MGKLLNTGYSCIHAAYWMFYGVISSFASVFLLAKGYSNWEIGITLAAGNVLAVVLQPIIADVADRVRKVSLIGITEILAVMMMVVTAALFVIGKSTAALSAVFILLIAWHTVIQPLLHTMVFKLSECGLHVNFGVARSIGSMGYAILVALLGSMVEKHGITVLPVTGEVVLVMLIVSLVLTKRYFDKANLKRIKAANVQSATTVMYSEPVAEKLTATEQLEEAEADRLTQLTGKEETINLVQFIRRNKAFFVLNLGVIGLYFSNSILCNYMMQIVDMVGGNSADMGRILAATAFCEIPTMMCFDWLRKRFSCQTMIKVGAIGFTVKIAVCSVATSVGMIFAAQFIQLVAFALFLPAMVHFIDEIMDRGEAAKGQALFTTMITVTTVFSSLTGGALLDMVGARMLTFIATAATAAGAVIIIAAVGKVKGKSAAGSG